MARSIFISYAGADAAIAMRIADELAADGIQSRVAQRNLATGDSFLGFMESSLSTSDYCLLLWSSHAAETPWVQVEWEAALYRSIQERRGFLVTGRLEDIPLPALLAPRIRVDLFPELRPGLTEIATNWRCDRQVEQHTKRPVADASGRPLAAPGQHTIYLTSDLFGITVPVKVGTSDDARSLMELIITRFNLPTALDHEGKFGVRIAYRLMYEHQPLDPSRTLMQQVPDRAVVWVETEVTPFAHVEPLSGELQVALYRGDIQTRAVEVTQRALRRAVVECGLAWPDQ